MMNLLWLEPVQVVVMAVLFLPCAAMVYKFTKG
jgi:hypothetical protein